jgi:hypothetical protein
LRPIGVGFQGELFEMKHLSIASTSLHSDSGHFHTENPVFRPFDVSFIPDYGY